MYHAACSCGLGGYYLARVRMAEGDEEAVEVPSEPEDEIEAVETAETIELAEETELVEPKVEILFACDNEDGSNELVEPCMVTLTAILHNFPENAELAFQWQNNANGEYVDVPGANGISYAFMASENNSGCSWRVNVTVI